MTSPFGAKTTEWLNGIGIYSLEEVKAIGIIETYWRLKDAYPHKVTLNMLYGLEAAAVGIDWRSIPEERKAELREEAKRHSR